jgi:hypothetical protein
MDGYGGPHTAVTITLLGGLYLAIIITVMVGPILTTLGFLEDF